jgi:hypothetical protein
MPDTFDFNTQTEMCQYCKKRVACDFLYNHLEFCESEEGRFDASSYKKKRKSK